MNEKLIDLVKKIEKKIEPQFKEIGKIKNKNSLKVIQAFQESNLQEMHLATSTGYGIERSWKK